MVRQLRADDHVDERTPGTYLWPGHALGSLPDHPMLTIDGHTARCIHCGSIDLDDTGYDHLFHGRQRQVIDALRALGTADADQITTWINQHHTETQRSATSKRLSELVDAGTATKDGTHPNHRGRRVALYRLTETARRQAA